MLVGLLVLLTKAVVFYVFQHCWWEAQLLWARLHIMKHFMHPKVSPDVCRSNGVLQHFEECLGLSRADSLQMMPAKQKRKKVDFSDVP